MVVCPFPGPSGDVISRLKCGRAASGPHHDLPARMAVDENRHLDKHCHCPCAAAHVKRSASATAGFGAKSILHCEKVDWTTSRNLLANQCLVINGYVSGYINGKVHSIAAACRPKVGTNTGIASRFPLSLQSSLVAARNSAGNSWQFCAWCGLGS